MIMIAFDCKLRQRRTLICHFKVSSARVGYRLHIADGQPIGMEHEGRSELLLCARGRRTSKLNEDSISGAHARLVVGVAVLPGDFALSIEKKAVA